MPFSTIQKEFLIQIKGKVPSNISFVDEIATELNISTDSAYRRIRGETDLTFDEYRKLGLKYNLSLDELLGNTYNTVLFKSRFVNESSFGAEKYLISIVEDLDYLANHDNKKLIYAAKDIPIFYLFIFKELAAFKIYFWFRSIFRFSGLQDKKFSANRVPQRIIELGHQIWEKYLRIPSLEIWSNETINATLRQIEFCSESGMFERGEDVELLCDRLLTIIDHLQKQAENGYKSDLTTSIRGDENTFSLYYNEVTISDNTIVFKMDDHYMTFFPHNVINILSTTNPDFCQQTVQTLDNIVQNSTLMSTYGAKERNRYFHKVRKKINELREKSLDQLQV